MEGGCMEDEVNVASIVAILVHEMMTSCSFFLLFRTLALILSVTFDYHDRPPPRNH